ncbi:hypothetical protein C8Q75DRAFT_741587 [Abortiporus biennis]|nr:hypothetical protein C8Q75DRAFT_741587 [Abortiporus biennis]
MHPLRHVPLMLFLTFIFAPLALRAVASHIPDQKDSITAKYSKAHSLGDNYNFDPSDGWQTVNATDLQYKYGRSWADEEDENDWYFLGKRADKDKKSKKKSKAKPKSTNKPLNAQNKAVVHSNSKSSSFTDSIKKIISSLKGVGKAEPVTITWYTGHDLLNPSCWPNPTWAPSDASFACALTLEGWTTRPKCFKFLELCNGPKKCVFVRVVDSCAGCAKGSKHVDLTQAAFTQLASLDQGLLQVQMRQATDPEGWSEDLWGPQHEVNN